MHWLKSVELSWNRTIIGQSCICEWVCVTISRWDLLWDFSNHLQWETGFIQTSRWIKCSGIDKMILVHWYQRCIWWKGFRRIVVCRRRRESRMCCVRGRYIDNWVKRKCGISLQSGCRLYFMQILEIKQDQRRELFHRVDEEVKEECMYALSITSKNLMMEIIREQI